MHSKLVPGAPEKVKVAWFWFVSAAGCESIETVGTVVSIVQLNEAAAPVLPAVSVARTWKVWVPSARPL